MSDITQKKIVFFGQDCHLYCDGKPVIRSGRDMNKWCARCCERSQIVN